MVRIISDDSPAKFTVCELIDPCKLTLNSLHHRQEIAIKPGSESYDKWVKLAVPLTIKYYLFNVTNAFQVINFGKRSVSLSSFIEFIGFDHSIHF